MNQRVMVLLLAGLLILGAAVWFGMRSIGASHAAEMANAVASARAAAPPPVELRVSAACAPGPGCVNCVDCACGPDEVAVSGGGFCGPNNPIIESAHQYGRSSADRFMNVWRLACNTAPPPNSYALCMKVPRPDAPAAP